MNFNEAPTAAAVEKYTRAILRAHPCSKIFTAGKSVLGRKIPVLNPDGVAALRRFLL